mgnify:CR=1 FL=1
MTYEEHRKRLIAYLLAKLEREDWHGVRDAVVDIEILEAEERGNLFAITTIAVLPGAFLKLVEDQPAEADPMREFAHALHMLKAYADNSGSGNDSATSAADGAATGSGISVVKTLHRIDEDTLKKEVEVAGFKFVGSADFLRHPEDPHTEPVFQRKENIDDFLLKFEKPRS